MYRYMHTARLVGATDTAEVRPRERQAPPSRTPRVQLDYPTWYARLAGAARPIAPARTGELVVHDAKIERAQLTRDERKAA